MTDITYELLQLAALAPEFEPHPFANPENRWLARSAFQKAIRRGQLERALMMGQLLYHWNETEAWRALATVVIEDVGIGDLDLVSYSCVLTLKSVREELTPTALFAAMIKRACLAVKSQACCELSLGAEKQAAVEGSESAQLVYQIMNTENNDLLWQWLEAPVTSLPQKYWITCELRKRLRGLGQDALMPTLERIMGRVKDEQAARACMLSFERTVDSMNLALLPVVLLLQDGPEDIHQDKETWPESVEINSVASEAYDMHTRAGSNATRRFAKELRKKRAWAKELPEDDKKPIGSLVFMVEGGAVDVRLRSQSLYWLRDYEHHWFAVGYGIPEETIKNHGLEEMKADVFLEIPMLNELRRQYA